MPPKQRKSIVWKHFTIKDGDGTKATCNHCHSTMAFSAATMSNMNRHLKRSHKEVFMEESKMEIYTVEGVHEVDAVDVEGGQTFEISMKGFEDLDNLIKSPEKGNHDPDWTPNTESVKSELLAEAGPSAFKKERKRSVVWDHFEKTSCKSSGLCLHCGKEIKLGTISNLMRHLRLKHPTVPVIFQRPDCPTVSKIKSDTDDVDEGEVLRGRGDVFTEVVEVNVDDMDNPMNIIETKTNENRTFFSNSSEIDYSDEMGDVNATQASQTEFLNEDFDINDYIRPKKVAAVVAEQVDSQLVRMIVKGCLPVNMTDQPEFREFASLLNPSYVLPSANKLAQELIPDCYRECEKRTTKSLQSAEGVALCIDQWKSKLHNYMCVTAHFVNTNCKFEALFLSCHILSQKEGAAEISERLLETARDWDIFEKIVAVTTDNSSLLTSAVKLCNWPHIPHFMRALTLLLHECLQIVKAIVIKVRNVTGELVKAPELLAEVYSTRKTLKLPPVKLIKKVSDGWSSSFVVLEMLTRFEKLKYPISQVLKNHPEIQLKIAETEWRSLSNFIEVLSVFKLVKREMVQGERLPVSKVVFYLRAIKNDMKKYQSLNDATYFATFITTNMAKHFEDLENTDLVASAVLLDPCLKKFVFKDESEFASACSNLKKEVCEVVLADLQYPEPNPQSIWHNFDAQIRKLNRVQDPIGKGILEFDNYTQEPLMDRSENPLVWWYERRAIYPRLYKLAKKYLCLTCKSSPRESISLKSAHMLSSLKYNELSSPTESEVMFLHHNM